MYRVDYYDTRNGVPLRPEFNSVDAAYKFMNERLNHKDVQEYIEHLRNEKKLKALNYAFTERHLHPVYGDIDKSLPTVAELQDMLDTDGLYEYRIGNSSGSISRNARTIYMKVSPCVYNIRKSVRPKQPNKLNHLRIQSTELLTNDYSRSYHE